MAKQRQPNNLVTAIKSVTAALRLESIPNPTDEQKKQIHDAKVLAADTIDNSNAITQAEFSDEDIAARITAEEQAELEAANIPPVIEAEVNEPVALPEPAENENEQPPLEQTD